MGSPVSSIVANLYVEHFEGTSLSMAECALLMLLGLPRLPMRVRKRMGESIYDQISCF